MRSCVQFTFKILKSYPLVVITKISLAWRAYYLECLHIQFPSSPFLKKLAATGEASIMCAGGRPNTSTIRAIWSCSFWPANNASPVCISTKIHPREVTVIRSLKKYISRFSRGQKLSKRQFKPFIFHTHYLFSFIKKKVYLLAFWWKISVYFLCILSHFFQTEYILYWYFSFL